MKNNKLTIATYVALGAVIMFVGLVILGFLLDSGNTTEFQTPSTDKTYSISDDKLSQEYKDAFVEGYVGESGNAEEAYCIINYLEYYYGANFVYRLAEDVVSGVLPPEAYEAINACTSEYYPTNVQ